MKQKMIALLLVLAMISTVVMFAVAEEPEQQNGEVTTITVVEPAESAAETTKAAEGITASNETVVAATTEAAGNEAAVPGTTEDVLKFEELEELVKKNNLSYKSLDETISGMNTLNDMADDLRDGIASIDRQIAMLDPAADAAVIAGLEAKKIELQQGLSGVSGMAQDTAQMDAGRKQLILGAQSLFIALVGMEQQEDALERQLAALDRTAEEMKMRNEMGQISEMQLMELQNGRTSLVSGLTTLRMNISNYKMQLEQMVGEELTGTIVLGKLPAVTEEELSAVNLEESLKTALKNNLDVKAADASRDKLNDMTITTPQMGSAVSDMQNGADYTYKATKQQAEMKFRMLYAQLQDCRQVLAASETALECEELTYQATELKYQQGTVSKNALLAAEDELKTAEDAVRTAKNNLFSTYNNYCWAVKHGVLS